MNLMNPQVEIKIERSSIHSNAEYIEAVKNQIKVFLQSTKFSFNEAALDEAIAKKSYGTITIFGIDFIVKCV